MRSLEKQKGEIAPADRQERSGDAEVRAGSRGGRSSRGFDDEIKRTRAESAREPVRSCYNQGRAI